jgi:hypothetical protein
MPKVIVHPETPFSFTLHLAWNVERVATAAIPAEGIGKRYKVSILCPKQKASDPIQKITKAKKGWGQALVAHAYNSSYSGGRCQEVHSSKLAQANNSQDPILKIPNTKKGWQSDSTGKVPA